MKKLFLDGLGDGLRIVQVLAVVAIPTAMLFFHVWNEFRITKLGYEVADQTDKHRRLIEERRKLSIEATFQGRSERVLSVAQTKFGLQPVQPDQIIEIDRADKSSGSAEQAALGPMERNRRPGGARQPNARQPNAR